LSYRPVNVWRPAAVELDKLADPQDVIAEGSVLWDVFRKTYELGYHTMGFPEEFGGMNQDILGSALVAELMGWAASDLAISLGVCSIPFTWAMFSPEPEMQELVRKFCADKEGKMTGCWSITEPNHGSDWISFDAEDGKNPACAPEVVAHKALINEMNESIYNVLSMFYGAYTNDAMVKGLLPVYQQSLQSGLFDPRIILGGCGAIARNNAPVFLDAPVVILMACDDRSIGGPQIQAGICGQNMNLAAMSLGLGFCWVGFSQVIEMVPELKEKLGLEDPWKINTAMVLGYPKFKQEGIVPREFRPVAWFREGLDGPVYEE
jgi:hypothetical protein